MVDTAVRFPDKKVVDELTAAATANAVDGEIGDVFKGWGCDALGLPVRDRPVGFRTRFGERTWEVRHPCRWIGTPLGIDRVERCDHGRIGREPLLEGNGQRTPVLSEVDVGDDTAPVDGFHFGDGELVSGVHDGTLEDMVARPDR